MELANATVNDLKSQRDFLIKKAVGGQRLALFRCAFSYNKAKEKAWLRWKDFAHSEFREDHQEATNINLEGIDTKKDRTKFLEEQNELLAKENDELK